MAFSFGQPSTTGGSSGFSFGSTPSAAPGGFSFGTPASSSGGLFGQANAFGSGSQSTTGGFSFGGSTTGSTSGVSAFGGGTTTAASSGFSFGSITSQPAGGTLFNFANTSSAAPASSAPQNMGSSSMFSFKTPGTTTATGLFQSSSAPSASTQPTTGGLLFGSTAPTGKPDGQSASTGATTSTGGFSFGGSLFQMPGSKASMTGSSTGTSSLLSFGQAAQTGAAVPAAVSAQPAASIFGKPNTSLSGQPQPGGGMASVGSSLFQGITSGTSSMPTLGATSAPTLGATMGAPAIGTAAGVTATAMTGGIAASAAQGTTQPLFGNLTSTAPQTSTFSFGAPVKPAGDSGSAATSSSGSMFTLGKTPSISQPTVAASTSFGLPVASVAATSAGIASFGAPAFSSITTSAPTFGTLQASSASAPSTAATGLTFPATGALKTSVPNSSSSLASSFTFGAPKVDAATTVTTGATSTAITESAFKPAVSAQASASGAAPTTAASTISTGPKLTYKQLEDIVNKWIQELEEQERVFLNQASQVNSWDRLLIENGEKITELHDEVERVKADQKRLDRELDFILSQQQELEDILKPLEESIRNQESIQYVQHTDIERERTYKLAENIDVELKRMMEDLREIIEHVNASNLSNRDQDDSMTQIVKILNAHMDALQWVDQNSGLLGRRVEEVARLMETRRRDHEKTMKLSFD